MKTYVLMSMPLFLWMIYQRVTAMTEKARTRESDEVTFMKMVEQVRQYEETERVAGGSRLLKGILECREVARAKSDAELPVSAVCCSDGRLPCVLAGARRGHEAGRVSQEVAA